LELEYGLGYFLEREKISIDYTDWFTGEQKTTNLNINLHYLEIPIGVRCKLFQNITIDWR
jgi:hypothetical protein